MDRFLSSARRPTNAQDLKSGLPFTAEEAIEKHLGDVPDFQETIFSELVSKVRYYIGGLEAEIAELENDLEEKFDRDAEDDREGLQNADTFLSSELQTAKDNLGVLKE